MLENITEREKILGVMTICAALIALTYNFAIEPLANRWNTLEKEISEKRRLLTKHRKILGDKEEIKRLHSEYTKYFQAEKLTPEEESGIALSTIEKLARQADAHITNIKPLTTRNFEYYTKFTFRVTTESRMSELAKFIYNLQSSEQLLKIERMVLRAKERQPHIIKAILHISKISVF